jgi:hypothetical protein
MEKILRRVDFEIIVNDGVVTSFTLPTFGDINR